MVSPLRLDWKGDADVPSNAHLVTTEVEWLRVASGLQSPDASGVMVRGANLCEWASQWWQTAGGACEEVHSTIDTLLVLSPDLSREEAQIVLVLDPSTDATKDFITFYNARPAGTAVAPK